MGKGIIKSGGDDGFYNVELTFERDKIDKTIAAIDAHIESLTSIIDIMDEGTEKELLKLERNSHIKKKEYLQNNMPEDTTVSAWCADLTEDITGNIGTIEVPGERGIVQIQPGYEDNSIYDATRDGQLQPSIASTPAATFYNLAMLPGWQKWKPTYRYGVISNIDTGANTCDVKLDEAESSQQDLNINQELNLTGISVSYMSCDSVAFEDGDNVLVKFEGQTWAGAQVIGFKDNPKACVENIYVVMIIGGSRYCFVWDVAKDGYASVPKNDGDPASFPCDTADISDWYSDKENVGSSLFNKEECGRQPYYEVELSCPGGEWGESGSSSNYIGEPSDCGCDFIDMGECSTVWDLATRCEYSNPDFWIWSGSTTTTRNNNIMWVGKGDYGKSAKIKFLNNSGVEGTFGIELEESFFEYVWSAEGASCGTNECDNIRLDAGEYEKVFKYHTPICRNIFEINYYGTKTWDMCNDSGGQSHTDYFIENKLQSKGSYSDKIITQIYTVEAKTVTRSANCAINENGWCSGTGCDVDTCNWDSEVYTTYGLKVAAQVGSFEDTDGIDPTGLFSNSSFESAITDMYDTLRVKENIPDDEIADALVAPFILKG